METELLNLRKQLAVAVRSIQWSYSIFWSTSPSDPGVLEWGEGYYNGDIKTRKTTQAVEFDVDQMGLQRSEQLRELYESLLDGESSPQARRPSASLSPEDLSNTEWYYLVCMSFVFYPGQGLPGRTLESGQPTWLCNAHEADNMEFSRTLLAKSASIQTVVCFPFLGGVVELGVTDLILKDHSVIQYVQDSLLGIDCPAPSRKPVSVINQQDSEVYDDGKTTVEQCEEVRVLESPDNSSNGFGMAFSDCMSQNQDQFRDDSHYQNVLVSIFKSTNELILEPCARNRDKESCFVGWKKEGLGYHLKCTNGSSQRLLKKILIEVPRMHPEIDELAERLTDKYSALKSLIPSTDKVDKASILDDTIKHLKDLKRRVGELGTCRDLDESNGRRTRRKTQDMSERTSDNYGNNKTLEAYKGLKNSSTNTNLSIRLTYKDVLIDLRCPLKECLLLEIMDVLSNLRLDTHSVQSSTSENILSLTIEAKIKGSHSLSAGMIRQVLHKVLMKVG